MWILTGLLLGSIITSTHADEEACRGRQAMLEKVKGVSQVQCRATHGLVYGTGTSSMLTVPNITTCAAPSGNCRSGAFD